MEMKKNWLSLKKKREKRKKNPYESLSMLTFEAVKEQSVPSATQLISRNDLHLIL